VCAGFSACAAAAGIDTHQGGTPRAARRPPRAPAPRGRRAPSSSGPQEEGKTWRNNRPQRGGRACCACAKGAKERRRGEVFCSEKPRTRALGAGKIDRLPGFPGTFSTCAPAQVTCAPPPRYLAYLLPRGPAAGYLRRGGDDDPAQQRRSSAAVALPPRAGVGAPPPLPPHHPMYVVPYDCTGADRDMGIALPP
jgi:hypothetical protein